MSIVYLEHKGELAPMRELPYDAEDVLQRLLADYPDLLAGEDGSARLMLIARELGVPDEEDGAGRWSLDHLFVDDQGMPTLVEVKRSSDSRLRREVVGQMLDYAAQGAAHWSTGALEEAFVRTCQSNGRPPEEELQVLGVELSLGEFLKRIETNLRAGRMRLLFVADEVPPELGRVIEFLNEQMTGVEVLAIEVRQYVEADGERRVLVPTTIGSTAVASEVKGKSTARRKKPWTEGDLIEELKKWDPPEYGERLTRLYHDQIALGARPSWGGGRHPSVTLWLGEEVENPVSISIYSGQIWPSLAINFDFVRDQRSEDEMHRLARLVRTLPGVPPYIEELEEKNWGMHRGMLPVDVLPDDEAVARWVEVLAVAATPEKV
jgi:hypothetical protein